MILMLI